MPSTCVERAVEDLVDVGGDTVEVFEDHCGEEGDFDGGEVAGARDRREAVGGTVCVDTRSL